MLELFNFKWDKRTARNIVMLPLIILRIPIILFFWGIEWINDWSEWVADTWPAWKSK